MSGLLSALLGSTSSSASASSAALSGMSDLAVSQAPTMEQPTLETSAASSTASATASATESTTAEVPASSQATQTDAVPAADAQTETPQAAPVTEFEMSGTFVRYMPDGTISTLEKKFDSFDEFEKYFTGEILPGLSGPESESQPAGGLPNLNVLPQSLRRTFEKIRSACTCPKCETWRKENPAAVAASSTSSSSATPAPQSANAQNTNAQNTQPSQENAKDSQAAASFVKSLTDLMSQLESKLAIAGKPETYKNLPACGSSSGRETFVPLMRNGVSTNNPVQPVGMSPEFYALQYCDVTTDAQANALGLDDWVNLPLLTDLIRVAATKQDLIPQARVRVVAGTYVRNRKLRTNWLGSVFIRRFQSWLSENFQGDANWSRVVVFDADNLGYTVCF